MYICVCVCSYLTLHTEWERAQITATSDGDIAGSSSENDEAQRLNHINKKNSTSPFGRRHFPRDSGCYEGSPIPTSMQNHQHQHQHLATESDTINNLDSVVTQCSNEILKRVENARKFKEEAHGANGSVGGIAVMQGGMMAVGSGPMGIGPGGIGGGGILMGSKLVQPKTLNRVAKKGLLGGSGLVDDLCSRGAALSEKSSDSGVSSSSLSSGPLKNNL